MSIELFSTNCPKCKILETKLREKKVLFQLFEGERAIESIQERGFMTAPLLCVDGKNMEFNAAMKWLSDIN